MNLTELRAEAATLLKVPKSRVLIETHSRGPLFRVGLEESDTPQAKALGVRYTFSPLEQIGEGQTPLAALLDLVRKIERERMARHA